MIVQVIVRSADETMLARYYEVEDGKERADTIRAALSTAYVSCQGKAQSAQKRLALSKDAVIAAYVSEGLSVRGVGQRYGVSPRVAGRFLTVNGVVLRSPAETRRNKESDNPEVRAQVIALARSHMTRREIAAKTGLSAYYIKIILRDAKVPLKKGRPKRKA